MSNTPLSQTEPDVPDEDRDLEFARALIAKPEASATVPMTGAAVCTEFDALSARVGGWNTLSSVNAAWHAFKCGVHFGERAVLALAAPAVPLRCIFAREDGIEDSLLVKSVADAERQIRPELIRRYEPAAQSAAPAVQTSDVLEAIMRDVCEAEPCNPDSPDAICIGQDYLHDIISTHLSAPAVPDKCQSCNGQGGTVSGGPCAECYGQGTYAGAREFIEKKPDLHTLIALVPDIGDKVAREWTIAWMAYNEGKNAAQSEQPRQDADFGLLQSKYNRLRAKLEAAPAVPSDLPPPDSSYWVNHDVSSPHHHAVQAEPAAQSADAVLALADEWEARGRGATPVDRMIVDKHVRELRECVAALSQSAAAFEQYASATRWPRLHEIIDTLPKFSTRLALRNAVAALSYAEKRGETQGENVNELHLFAGAGGGLLGEPSSAAAKAEPAAPTMRDRLQQQCSDWGAYWRASDTHGVELTKAQAVELLQDALGVDVEIKAEPPEQTRSQKLAEAGHTRRPTWHALPADEAEPAEDAAPGGVIIDCYALPAERFKDETKIQRARQIEGPDLWKVKRGSDCLSKTGEWEWEPMPSSRDDEFMARCRFSSATEAIDAAIQAEAERKSAAGGGA